MPGLPRAFDGMGRRECALEFTARPGKVFFRGDVFIAKFTGS
jgi:hypothetical protein